MNANILKRVVRAIADGSQSDLDRLADKIVETERRTGHKKLADQLKPFSSSPDHRGTAMRQPSLGTKISKSCPSVGDMENL